MARRPPGSHLSSSSQDEIQALLDECDRMQRNWDLPGFGRAKSHRRERVPEPHGKGGKGQVRDMLSWALARHRALEEETKQEKDVEFLSLESVNMADALQEAHEALQDAKLRIRAAEAAEREKVREQLKAEMYEARKDRRTVSEVKTDLDSSAPEACSAQESEELSGMSQHGSDLEAPPKPSEQDQLSQPFVPKPPSRDQASARPPRWKVVGGVGKGGIIVRQERDLQSEQLTERLSTGAIVEEIELFGDRLHYSRLSGTGPQTGWVSLRMARKELLIPVKPPARPARPLLGQAPGRPGRPARPEWRHWHSEELPFTQMEPPIRSSSAQSERCERKPTSLPRLPQPKSAPPPRTRPDLTLPPLPPLLPNGKPIHQAM